MLADQVAFFDAGNLDLRDHPFAVTDLVRWHSCLNVVPYYDLGNFAGYLSKKLALKDQPGFRARHRIDQVLFLLCLINDNPSADKKHIPPSVAA